MCFYYPYIATMRTAGIKCVFVITSARAQRTPSLPTSRNYMAHCTLCAWIVFALRTSFPTNLRPSRNATRAHKWCQFATGPRHTLTPCAHVWSVVRRRRRRRRTVSGFRWMAIFECYNLLSDKLVLVGDRARYLCVRRAECLCSSDSRLLEATANKSRTEAAQSMPSFYSCPVMNRKLYSETRQYIFDNDYVNDPSVIVLSVAPNTQTYTFRLHIVVFVFNVRLSRYWHAIITTKIKKNVVGMCAAFVSVLLIISCTFLNVLTRQIIPISRYMLFEHERRWFRAHILTRTHAHAIHKKTRAVL